MIVSKLVISSFETFLQSIYFLQQNLLTEDCRLLRNKFAGVLEPRRPVYSITDYSSVRSRPDKTSKIYLALRGPNANEAQVFITKNDKGVPIKKCNLKWFDDEPLFLYVGRRYCVENGSESRSLASYLFRGRTGRSYGASLFARKEKKRHPELVGVNELILKQLMIICGTTGKNIPVAKLNNLKKP